MWICPFDFIFMSKSYCHGLGWMTKSYPWLNKLLLFWGLLKLLLFSYISLWLSSRKTQRNWPITPEFSFLGFIARRDRMWCGVDPCVWLLTTYADQNFCEGLTWGGGVLAYPHCKVLIGVIITVTYAQTASLSGLFSPTLPHHVNLHWFRSLHLWPSRKKNYLNSFWRRLKWIDYFGVVHWLSSSSFGCGRALMSA